MTARIPVLRAPFKHPELAKIDMQNDTLTTADLALLVKNTNFLIGKSLHAPGYRLTHDGKEDLKGKSLGWITRLEIKDGRAVCFSEFTENGKKLIRAKDVRWVSSGIRKDFKLSGEPEGLILPGPYLHHVALLGDELPMQKGLVDLHTVEFSEVEASGREMFIIDQENGEVAYFAEIDKQSRKEIAMKDEDKDSTVPMALFQEEQRKNAKLTEENTTLKGEVEKEKQKNRDLEARDEQVRFSEHSTEVKDRVKKVQEKAKFGASMYESYVKIGEAAFGDKKREAAFAELMSEVEKQRSGIGDRLVKDDDEESNDEETSEFAEDGSDLSEQDLNKAGYDPEIGARVSKVLAFRRQKNKKFSLDDLRAETRSRARR